MTKDLCTKKLYYNVYKRRSVVEQKSKKITSQNELSSQFKLIR